jgi:hypothetical protein
MGRPLFSLAYTAPSVRVEPEPYEKWSVWNPFDPDSEEFFADAVVERMHSPEPEVSTLGGSLVVEEEAESSSSSEASSSGRATPTNDDDGLSVEELEVEYRRRAAAQSTRRSPSASPAPVDDGQTYRAVARPGPATSYVRSSWHAERSSRSPSPIRITIPRSQVAPEPIPVAASPATSPVRTNPIPIPAPARPTTPQNNTPTYFYGSPSPPPSVTPRLYTWARTALPAAASPSSPLPNRSARRSLAHIAASPRSVPTRVVV